MSEPDSLSTAATLPQIGSYRLVEPLGSGGMSSVFKAVHAETGHEVAVKVLPRSLAKNPTLLQRFLREAKSAEALEHPNIVAIFDRGSEAGRYYLVLELVDGGDLHDKVRNLGPFSVGEAVRVLREVALALKYAAEKGVIHRDIKPANILIGLDGRVKLTDLGLALQAEDEDERVTRDGTTVGTVDYMSPEQARDSRATSLKSDMYSLGCTAHYILTGKPPFVGGDLSDKLRRHVLEPPPDVRATRPDVPPPLAALIRRLMAKKPEGRFASYDDLLGELDRIALGGEPLVALIDEDDDSAASGADFTLGAGDLLSLDSGTPTIPNLKSTRGRRDRPSRPARNDEVSLTELAALDEGDDPRPARRKPASTPAFEAASPISDSGLDEDEFLARSAPPPRSSGREDESVKTWILRGLMIGSVIVLIGVGIRQLVEFSRPNPDEPPIAESESSPPIDVAGPSPPAVDRPRPPAPRRPETKPAGASEPPAQAPIVTWTEPVDVEPASRPEDPVSPAIEGRFRPDWSFGAVPTRIEGPTVTVRRLESGKDLSRAPTLAKALEQPGGTIEIADDGPFFEKDLKLGAKSRLIRARPGYRPILVVEAPAIGPTRQAPGAFEVSGARLILDGLDIVVSAREPAREPSSVFLVRGGDLVLRDCSITVVGPADRVFSLVQVGPRSSGSGPPRVSLERTSARGNSLGAVRFSGSPGEVVVDRSVILCGSSPAIISDGEAIPGSRRLSVIRSILASQGPMLDLGGPGVAFRTLGSTLAHVDGREASPLIAARDSATASPRLLVDWAGARSEFAGWSHWMTTVPANSVRVADFASARSFWPGSDGDSASRSAGWPDSILSQDRPEADLGRLAPDRGPTLDRVARPSPWLRAKAVESFARQSIAEPSLPAEPGVATAPVPASTPAKDKRPAVASPFSASAGPTRESPNLPPNLRPPGPAIPKAGPPSPGADPEVVDLEFDASDPRWGGDLGLFLRDSIPGHARLVRVRASGRGAHRCTSIRPPEGLSIAVSVIGDPGEPDPLSWIAGADDPLIGVRSADLTLTGVRLSGDPGGRTGCLVRVEDGVLTIRKSRLQAPWSTSGLLASIRGAGTRPLASRPKEPGPRPDRPVLRIVDSVLQTGGTAVSADLARGVVALENCVVNVGSAAFDLRPRAARRDRFEADLWLDRCSIASERDVVRFGGWPGMAPGPDRPWLVSTRGSAFLGAFDRVARDDSSVLLRADAEGMGQGGVAWQSSGDLYDCAHFAAEGNSPPAENPRPDLARQWADLWGRGHVKDANGPAPGGGRPRIRPVQPRLSLGGVRLGDLALEYSRAADPKRTIAPFGADLRSLGIVPSPPIGARPR